jgi:hypothetical protein
MGEVLSHCAFLEKGLSLDFEELEFYQLVILRQATELGKVEAGLILATVVNKPSGRERHENHATEQNQAGGDLKTNGNQPSCIRLLASLSPANVVGTTA